METEDQNKEGKGTEPAQPTSTELAPLSIIRTEATLSKFPIHTLDKKGNVNIRIVKKTAKGEIDVKWIVSHNSQAGRPGQLAYKLDTIIVNRRIDEVRAEQNLLPEIVRLGSLYEIAQELGLKRDTNSVRKALLQNSGANIDAKIRYTTVDGVEREVTFNDTRYGVLFTGEKFPDGRKADAVYLSLHSFYREVLNNSPVRPLNYDYLKELPPSAQRFYEIVSRKMFAALKYGHAHAKLSYSEFCTYSAQQRQVDYDHFKKQMYKIHRPHIKSGYITAVEYTKTTDEEGNLDWLMLYTPGPKAKAEFDAFNGVSRVPRSRRRKMDAGIAQPIKNISESEPFAVPLLPTTEGREEVDQNILKALTDRGIFKTTAVKLITGIPSDRLEAVADYIDYWDRMPREKAGTGLLHDLIKNGDPLPPTFETRGQREKRQDDQQRRDKQRIVKEALTADYEKYLQSAVDRFITDELGTDVFERRVVDRAKELSAQADLDLGSVWNRPHVIEASARRIVREQIEKEKEMSFLPFDEFRKRELPRILAELGLDPVELGINPPKPEEIEPETAK